MWESKREDREGVLIYEGMSECACVREGGRLRICSLCILYSVFIIFRHHLLHHVMSWHIDIYVVVKYCIV